MKKIILIITSYLFAIVFAIVAYGFLFLIVSIVSNFLSAYQFIENINQANHYLTMILFLGFMIKCFNLMNNIEYKLHLDKLKLESDIALLWLLALGRLPVRTIFYSIYIAILVTNHLINLQIISISNIELLSFLKANEYSIILLIAFDRINNTWEKEKIIIKPLKQIFSEYFK